MALFSKKGAKKEDTPATKSETFARDLSHILKHARITEKATMHSQESVYTFDVDKGATKNDVARAVRELYKVTPRLVRIVPVPRKVRRNMRTGKVGVSRAGKKAYVYLKKGEQITIS